MSPPYAAVAVITMSPVALAIVTTPALYAASVISEPPIVTVTSPRVYVSSAVRVAVNAAPSLTVVPV